MGKQYVAAAPKALAIAAINLSRERTYLCICIPIKMLKTNGSNHRPLDFVPMHWFC